MIATGGSGTASTRFGVSPFLIKRQSLPERFQGRPRELGSHRSQTYRKQITRPQGHSACTALIAFWRATREAEKIASAFNLPRTTSSLPGRRHLPKTINLLANSCGENEGHTAQQRQVPGCKRHALPSYPPMRDKNVTTTRVNLNKIEVFNAFRCYAKQGYARVCDLNDPTWPASTMSGVTRRRHQACSTD